MMLFNQHIEDLAMALLQIILNKSLEKLQMYLIKKPITKHSFKPNRRATFQIRSLDIILYVI